ncbi:hypothetical protein ANCCAN_02341 [Ancylostoma caninum]|uniref:Serpentine receptor class gamma n=1 Tax=Ancylostoma caninum TaxID=29170 RepID=A0A368H4Y4_ANCCA|nr:hypothetical protein ANCCAN_02341 [Ancylostoma caninum]
MPSTISTIVDPLFVISVSAIIYYSYILYILATSKSYVFRSMFFRIFIFTGVFDITTIIAQEWIRADFKFGFARNFEYGTRLMMTLTGTNMLIHVFGTFLMSLNRYTASCKPKFHQKATRLMGALVVITFEIINIILIVFTFRSIRRQKKKFHRKMGQETSFVILTAINCPVNLLEAFYDLSFLFNFESSIIAWIQSQVRFSECQFDVYFLIMMTMNAYSILILSRALQLEILMRWKCSKYNSSRITSNNKPSNALFTIQ